MVSPISLNQPQGYKSELDPYILYFLLVMASFLPLLLIKFYRCFYLELQNQELFVLLGNGVSLGNYHPIPILLMPFVMHFYKWDERHPLRHLYD